MDYISIDSSADVIEHFGVKGMKWGQRLSNRVKSYIDKRNEKIRNNNHRYMINDYNYQKKYNNAEWKAVQKHTRKSSFSPLTKKTLRRQQAEYAKLNGYKKQINDLNIERIARFEPRDRNHVKKEHLAEYDKMDKILKSYNRPHHDGPKLEKWDNAYNRQVELTKNGMNYKYAKAKKAYNDYLNY